MLPKEMVHKRRLNRLESKKDSKVYVQDLIWIMSIWMLSLKKYTRVFIVVSIFFYLNILILFIKASKLQSLILCRLKPVPI